MTDFDTNLIAILMILSVVLLASPFLIYYGRKAVAALCRKPTIHIRLGGLLGISLGLIGSIWCLRYAVGYYAIVTAADTILTLEPWEEIFNAMAHALQTFSMDEDYTAYILEGKRMLFDMLGENTRWANVYGIYASVLNFAAPIAGGAIILDILASCFPKIKLHMSYWQFWREKYFFSELNSASLELAKDIYKVYGTGWRRPVLIFTDAYVDDEEEHGSELLMEAKRIGALCIRDDMAHVTKNRLGHRKFFLIDEDTVGNLETLTNLSDDFNYKYLKKAEVFFFAIDDSYLQVENCVRDRLLNERHFTEEELPVFGPVRVYFNLITNMLDKIPLYEPLIGKARDAQGKVDLNVTILGAGGIGTEMFLSTYWFGQILDCRLNFRILSNESEEEFWSKIDYINPEIRHTTIPGDPILRINRKGDLAEPYCNVTYVQCDAKSSEFIRCLAEPCCETSITDSDYVLVALGSDEINISVANTIRKHLGKAHIERGEAASTVIAYVVYDSELADTLNRNQFFGYRQDRPNIFMCAVGSSRDVYSVRNVFMTDHIRGAMGANEIYELLQNRDARAKAHTKRMKDDYKYWASMARKLHMKYKFFSMGLFSRSLFDYAEDAAQTAFVSDGIIGEDYKFAQEMAREAYSDIAHGRVEFGDEEEAKAHLQLLHRMAWLEHRRWNAFTRIRGFRYTGKYDAYAVSGQGGSYKQMDLRLHPCLVECDQLGIRAVMDYTGQVDESTLLRCTDREDFDFLDELTYDLYEKEYNGFDMKIYDYPAYDPVDD